MVGLVAGSIKQWFVERFVVSMTLVRVVKNYTNHFCWIEVLIGTEKIFGLISSSFDIHSHKDHLFNMAMPKRCRCFHFISFYFLSFRISSLANLHVRRILPEANVKTRWTLSPILAQASRQKDNTLLIRKIRDF